MASWRKLLAEMVADPDPRSYTYDEAAGILMHLGFLGPQKPSGSHRKFRLEVAEGGRRRGVIIALVDKGRGTLKPKYILVMVQTLRENNLLPDGVDTP
jgi:hypothetical protein